MIDHEPPDPFAFVPPLSKKDLDRAVRAALADPPTDEEAALADALARTLHACLAADPVRLAAAALGPAPGALPLKDQAENAVDADHDAQLLALRVVSWMREYARATVRLGDARLTDAPEEVAAALLPPWEPFPPFDPRRELLTPTQAADRLGTTPATLRAWSVEGIVPSVRLPNGRRRYTPAAIDAARERIAQEHPR